MKERQGDKVDVDIPEKYDLGYSDPEVVNAGWMSYEQNQIVERMRELQREEYRKICEELDYGY